MNVQEFNPVATLDVQDLSCPMPLIQARRALAKISPGDILEVLCTYHESQVDAVPGWCQKCGHIFLCDVKDSGFRRVYIQKQ